MKCLLGVTLQMPPLIFIVHPTKVGEPKGARDRQSCNTLRHGPARTSKRHLTTKQPKLAK